MVLRVKPKQFGPVFIRFDGSESIEYAYFEPTDFSPCPPTHSPVDTLLASLGSCIVKSVQWSASQHKVATRPFTVKATGTKAPVLPGRVEKMELMIIGNPVEDETLVPRIASQAKSFCTVSNTLNCEVTITVEAVNTE